MTQLAPGDLHILRSPAPCGNLFAQFDVNGDARVDREEYGRGNQGVSADQAIRAAWAQQRAEEVRLHQDNHALFLQQTASLMNAGPQVIEAPALRMDGSLAVHGGGGEPASAGPGNHTGAEGSNADFTFGDVPRLGGGAPGTGECAALGGAPAHLLAHGCPSAGACGCGVPGELPTLQGLAATPGMPTFMAPGMPVRASLNGGISSGPAQQQQQQQQGLNQHPHGVDTSPEAWEALGLPPLNPMLPLGSPGNPVIHKDTLRITLPEPLYPGGKRFFAGVSEMNAAFAATELCATQEPECSLAPQPQVKAKKWYNTYLYRPEEHSHVERQYLERFVPGPDGEWIDTVKAKRMAQHLEAHQRVVQQAKMEKKALLEATKYADSMGQTGAAHGGAGGMGAPRGVGMGGAPGMAGLGMGGHGVGMDAFAGNTDPEGDLMFRPSEYYDAYSGERMMLTRDGSLMPIAAILEEAGVHRSLGGELLREVKGFDFDNLRIPWPFGYPYRNKKISQHSYEWFDRTNPYIPNDRAYEFVELPSIYIDKEEYYNSLRPGRRQYEEQVLEPPAIPVQ